MFGSIFVFLSVLSIVLSNTIIQSLNLGTDLVAYPGTGYQSPRIIWENVAPSQCQVCIVRLEGLIKYTPGGWFGGPTASIASVPIWARPPKRLTFATVAFGQIVRVDVDSNGQLWANPNQVSGKWPISFISVSGISWDVRP